MLHIGLRQTTRETMDIIPLDMEVPLYSPLASVWAAVNARNTNGNAEGQIRLQ